MSAFFILTLMITSWLFVSVLWYQYWVVAEFKVPFWINVAAPRLFFLSAPFAGNFFAHVSGVEQDYAEFLLPLLVGCAIALLPAWHIGKKLGKRTLRRRHAKNKDNDTVVYLWTDRQD